MSFMLPLFTSNIQKGKLIADGLITCMPFTDTSRNEVRDEGGQRRHGYTVPVASWDTRRVGGLFGGSLSFTRASSEYLDFGSQLFDNYDRGTMTGFVSVGAIGDGEFHQWWALSGGNVATPGIWGMNFSYEGGTNYINVTQLNDGGGTLNYVRFAYTLQSAGWKHLALVSDGSTWTPYVDAVPYTFSIVGGANNGNWVSDTPFAVPRFLIGASGYDGSTANFANMLAADFRMYSRPLDQAEIALIAAGIG